MAPETGANTLNAFVDMTCSDCSKNTAYSWWFMHLHFGQRPPKQATRAKCLSKKIALSSERPHRFGRAYQLSLSDQSKRAKSNNFKCSIVVYRFCLKRRCARARKRSRNARDAVNRLDFMDIFAKSGL